MKKVIRLSERELTKLIKNIVLEEKRNRNLYEGELTRKGDTQDLGMEMFEEDDFEEVDFEETESSENMSQQDKVRKIADFLQDEVLSELSPRELSHLKREVSKSKMGGMSGEMSEEDEMDDLKSRRRGRLEKGLMRGGLGMSGVGALTALGEIMGYSEFDLTNMLHDINSMAGLGKYTGPATFGLVFAGLALALKGLDMRMKRTGK